MKKNHFFIMIGLVLALSLVLFACDDGKQGGTLSVINDTGNSYNITIQFYDFSRSTTPEIVFSGAIEAGQSVTRSSSRNIEFQIRQGIGGGLLRWEGGLANGNTLEAKISEHINYPW